jgi:TRAP-type mannitol/chloroaromatic compound transport system substrate-binding protein
MLKSTLSMMAVIAGLAISPMSNAQTVIRVASSYPAVSTFNEQAVYIAKKVDTLTDGKVKLDIKAAGALVPAFETLDATASGAVDATWTQSYYWVGKDKTLSLFNSPVGGPYGMDGMDFLGWMFHGGGLEMYNEFYQKHLKLDVVVFPVMPTQNQPLGWFKRPIKDLADFKNFTCRQTGLNQELYSRMGMKTVNLPGGEILAAAQRGVIDCAEFVGGLEDQRLGFPTVWKYYYLHSLHENSNTGDLIINGGVWRKLTKQQQESVRAAAYESYLWWLTDVQGKNGQALKEMIEQHGIKVMRTPKDIILAELQTIDKIFAEESAKNPWFKKVLESQKAWAAKVVPYKRVAFTPYDYAADYYWGQKSKK